MAGDRGSNRRAPPGPAVPPPTPRAEHRPATDPRTEQTSGAKIVLDQRSVQPYRHHRVHAYAPRRAFRVRQDMREGRRLLQDIRTLTSHTNNSNTAASEALRPPRRSPHRDAVVVSQPGGQQQEEQRRPGNPLRTEIESAATSDSGTT